MNETWIKKLPLILAVWGVISFLMSPPVGIILLILAIWVYVSKKN